MQRRQWRPPKFYSRIALLRPWKSSSKRQRMGMRPVFSLLFAAACHRCFHFRSLKSENTHLSNVYSSGVLFATSWLYLLSNTLLPLERSSKLIAMVSSRCIIASCVVFAMFSFISVAGLKEGQCEGRFTCWFFDILDFTHSFTSLYSLC